jgi:hypothetical protein
MVGWSGGRSVGWLVIRSGVGHLVYWLIGCLVGQLVSWLNGWWVGCLVVQLFFQPMNNLLEHLAAIITLWENILAGRLSHGNCALSRQTDRDSSHHIQRVVAPKNQFH